MLIICFFFFSSRRRHTRCLSDWSSDVCSSDLLAAWPQGDPLSRRYVGRGAVAFDFDDDGDEDILLTQNDRPAVLLRNAGPPRAHWLTLTLEGVPPNRDAVGAVVRLEAGGR